MHRPAGVEPNAVSRWHLPAGRRPLRLRSVHKGVILPCSGAFGAQAMRRRHGVLLARPGVSGSAVSTRAFLPTWRPNVESSESIAP